ncbi:hypothetical protein XF_1466 [Xylella fastidiosa 9a5c]|uniref:Uncharacterized protein n=1 Tax=Xylella fastidiosa (strain 9a5c) TaxID=160492 RepID=Q9PDB3_XYLFA|nr:hypothetical protein XF_1466 [Xylella fastidiosa 9a5c]
MNESTRYLRTHLRTPRNAGIELTQPLTPLSIKSHTKINALRLPNLSGLI